MGQKVLGVLYGCVVPASVDLRGDDGLLDKWEANRGTRKLGLRFSDQEGGKVLFGFCVGIGGYEKGLRNISTCCIPLTVIEKSQEAMRATASWTSFTRFAKSNGVNLPSATFWLAPLEITSPSL